MPVVTMKELLEAGVHFGHQSKRWNPKMEEYIYSSRNGIHVIDLHKTIPLIEKAFEFVKEVIKNNGSVLFVGTKKQAQEAIEEEAKRCSMFYVKDRWLGGTLTNFKTIKKTISRMKEIEKMEIDGMFETLPRKEVASLKREHKKMIRGLGGIRDMNKLPNVIFVIDSQNETTAIAEAKKLSIPVIAVVDTNCDPDNIDFPIPANDDAIRSIKLLTSIIAEAVLVARELAKPPEERNADIAIPEEDQANAVDSMDTETMEEALMLSEEERLSELAPEIVEEEEEKEVEERTGF
ncbi:30S ribosomal protein S2 [candidate division WOR-1 bacterium RIFOXYD2_FULL_36_8]|uniref:Small ribosomal subunit protein uS2 n=1 Tax=candidate division WOR-1 bacterium RIFOXYB2_FULL_36_35 TaxID=1802578 RepID=A0A1F4S2G1_UNCSA|nr:MAG: 30S ribosomal protein S2 [candidate division WOR-1 bacterium RIFOXYA2_FULL_36_21]OGC14567.1 MAG: 30S ribosomal protein S2 [candidate division WOR-1 bacterium RIFOXYB2_FULL_36_35]OGC16239.1 MAG: 30S ribosomal protein S2 [candidate division WOR-1 bacterium RIFOXYA12_FULL_36_13]OGC39056.1 MAG: 30S ribosomal protein S2 [candidate division WOR-1 bacterium RIFOXYD2_FULL_36_8]